ncbi:metallophosphoesterase family protein [Solihabitans fulvus]|uniref:Metallophosphoesterase family protein n=1 Tax=Solihabitans fulvus TaxID=1892852 RepID=A0A5B2XE55_9PSEU|nr:metallophosphoesterase family protein [Solihabitans fulvus]KAA2261987.1 metallophosphoesterase family protein [Solihabitans fulvus]
MEIPRVGVPDALANRLSIAEQHEYLTSRFGRRTLLRGGMATAAALAAGPTLLAGLAYADGDRVAPFGRHLAFGRNPRHEIRVAWQVPAPVRRPFLRVGARPHELTHRVPAEVRALHSEVPGVIAPTDQYYLHAEIGGLRPGRTYYYAVGHDGFDPAKGDGGPAAISTFTTAPARGFPGERFTFTAFGDQGVSTAALAENGVVARQNPVFHLLAGDIAYADPSGRGLPIGSKPDGTHDIFDPKVWDAYLTQIEPLASRIPWMVATGNHDMEALYSTEGYGGQVARWAFPGSGPSGCPSVYSFIYGNVGVISLDANDVSYEIPANLGYSDGGQTEWLRRRLAFLRCQPDVDFVVVFFHHCAFSTTSAHASEGGVRDEWVPLFDRFKVDLVINGHNHVYERTDALRGGQVATQVPIGGTVRPDRDGTVYATCGSGGRSLYSFPVPDSYAGHETEHVDVPTYVWKRGGGKENDTVAWSRVRYTGYAFMALDVQPASWGRQTTITARVLSNTGVEIDRFVVSRTAGLHVGIDLGDGNRLERTPAAVGAGADPGDS